MEGLLEASVKEDALKHSRRRILGEGQGNKNFVRGLGERIFGSIHEGGFFEGSGGGIV